MNFEEFPDFATKIMAIAIKVCKQRQDLVGNFCQRFDTKFVDLWCVAWPIDREIAMFTSQFIYLEYQQCEKTW